MNKNPSRIPRRFHIPYADKLYLSPSLSLLSLSSKFSPSSRMWTDLFPFPPPAFPISLHLSEVSEKKDARHAGTYMGFLRAPKSAFLCRPWWEEGERGACDIGLIWFWWLVSVVFNSIHFLLAGDPRSRLAGGHVVHFMHPWSTTFCRIGWMHVLFDSLISWARGGGYHVRASFYEPSSSLIFSLISGFNQIPSAAFALRPLATHLAHPNIYPLLEEKASR